ncbi:F-box/FBD/LRR-repeat protein At5g56420-like isoform X2 [Carex rostrata]
MADSSTDRLSNLPDALLITIISFLPTRIAARTSVLCRRFHHLWEASPSVEHISYDIQIHPKSFAFYRSLFHRNPDHPLHSLRLVISPCNKVPLFIFNLFAKARSLHFRHLTIEGCWFSSFLPFFPIIFTIKSLRTLSLDRLSDGPTSEFNFPSGIMLTCLSSLTLRLYRIDPAKLYLLLSELCSLEDLELYTRTTPGLNLSSQTIRKLKLVIAVSSRSFDFVGLSLPSLESLHLEIQDSFRRLLHIHGEVPSLRKAVIYFHDLHDRDVSVVSVLLNCISHVEELSLHLKENEDTKYPTPVLLESGKDMPNFYNLKHLDLTLCFHEHNFEAVMRMLLNSPLLNSLKLVHEGREFTGWATERKRKHWSSMLPRNANGNYCYAHYRNLHLEEDPISIEFMKYLSKKCTSKRQAMSC